ncbi:hypothetical protein ZWY2020_015556 [Hordeum vulgare]|nr:hypothetical protein ZWY2020_015556 [Hordeum vulgare]
MAASATTGALNPLLGKLSQLLGEEYKKLTEVRKQAAFLKDELSAMKALLDKMELMDKLDPSAKNWRDHIREMSYDMENCIDDFIHDIEGASAKKGFVRKMAQRLRRLGRRHQIANRIKELKSLAVEANARRERYKIDECINSSHATVVVDPRITAIYKEAAGLVGIDGPRDELYGKCLTLEQEDALVSSIGMLRDLKCLRIYWRRWCSEPDSQLDSLHDPPPRLEELNLLYWQFRRVPKWIGELCCLRILKLKVLHMSSDEVRILGELPSLVEVGLYVSDVSQDKVVVGMGLFPVLEHFRFQFDKDVNVYLSFEAGAMPKLQELSTEWRGTAPVGMECLPCLQHIDVCLSHTVSHKNWEDVRAKVESAFKSAASLHPRHPSVSVC